MKSLLVLAVLFLSSAARASHDDHDRTGPPPHRVWRETLAPYGSWHMDVSFGWVWRPARVERDWRPYTTGRWTWNGGGWVWAADERWGAIPYSYGRWAWRPVLGWVWVPGHERAMEWVVWRYDGDHVGWAPRGYDCDPDWVYVRIGDFGSDRHVRRVVVAPPRVRMQSVYTQAPPRHWKRAAPTAREKQDRRDERENGRRRVRAR